MVIGMCVLVRTEGARWAMVSRMRVSLASAGARGRTSFNQRMQGPQAFAAHFSSGALNVAVPCQRFPRRFSGPHLYPPT